MMQVHLAQSKAETLLNKGRAHLDAGQRAQAEVCFQQASRTFMTPVALNNWALCRYLAGDYKDALSILQPLLGAPDPLPYTHALASLSYTAMGNTERAHEQMRAAIHDFDRGLDRGGAADLGWAEYTVTIKRAAGEAGEHRLVLDLHGRWPGRNLPSGAFAAGAAAFNLGRFGQASKYWRGIADPVWVRLMEAYALVASLAENRLVPQFLLEYEPYIEQPPKDVSPEVVKALASKGAVRVGLLATAFAAPDSNAAIIDALIGHTGGWGIDLGQRLLAGSRVPISVKMGAAKALTDAGVFAPGQQIPIVHEGRPTTITLSTVEVAVPNAELDQVVDEAIRLRDSGRKDAAYDLLARMEAEGTIYPPAMVTLANLMRDRGELAAARSKLELADKLMTGNPGVLFNLAGLWLQLGEPKRALEYARKIDPKGTPMEFRRRLAEFTGRLMEQVAFITNPFDAEALADRYRLEVEEKPINPDLRLRTALRQIPVQWLNAVARMYHLESVPRRPERERLVAEEILDPLQLKLALSRERSEVQDALRFIVGKGGWVKMQTLTRRYGALDGDGFWWDEEPPSSSIGRLRLLGSVFVGRANIGGKQHKIAVVPVELRGEGQSNP
jgi:tetratricopeptide (TPR) repeat protein